MAENKKCLEFDENQINSLELPLLREISPIFDKKQKEVSKTIQRLQAEKKQVKQTANGLELKKDKLKTMLLKRNSICEDLCKRGTKAQKEFEKTNVMCPIYQFQIDCSLIEDNAPKLVNPDGPSYSELLVTQEQLTKLKDDCKKEIGEMGEIMDGFIQKYLI